jgi:hypothetical protein
MADNDCLHLLHLDLAGLPCKNHAQSLDRSQISKVLRSDAGFANGAFKWYLFH